MSGQESKGSTLFSQIPINLRAARFDRQEAAGSVGDLGTYLPLLVGMVSCCGLDLASALLFSGLFNIMTGLSFGLPMAVQPMKAIATVAITEGLTVPQILASGILTGAAIFLLGLSGGIDWLNRRIPWAVVRGLQLALGLSLIIKGIEMVALTGGPWGTDSWAMGFLGALLLLMMAGDRRFPGALILFLGGLLVLLLDHPLLWRELRLTLSLPHLTPIPKEDWWTALWKGTIPQIPLTTLNSVIAVSLLSADLFPHLPAEPRKVAVSVGLMNLVSCWFGAMPMCHGAGGLAGQYRFGARSAGSVLILGSAKILLGLLFGNSLLGLIRHYPQSLLGVLLLFAGMELALVARDVKAKDDFFILLLTAGAILALRSTALGFTIGLALALLLRSGFVRVQ